MPVVPQLAEVAQLVGDPGRANILSTLMDGRTLTAKELAIVAGVTAQTASTHLAKLVEQDVARGRSGGDAGFRHVEEHRFGRFRRFRGHRLVLFQRRVLALDFAECGERVVDLREELLALGAAEVERTGGDQVLEHALVDRARVGAQEEVVVILVGATAVALGDDLRRRLLTHALDSRQAEPDRAGGAIRFGVQGSRFNVQGWGVGTLNLER